MKDAHSGLRLRRPDSNSVAPNLSSLASLPTVDELVDVIRYLANTDGKQLEQQSRSLLHCIIVLEVGLVIFRNLFCMVQRFRDDMEVRLRIRFFVSGAKVKDFLSISLVLGQFAVKLSGRRRIFAFDLLG